MGHVGTIYSDGEIEDKLIEVLNAGGNVFEIPYNGGAIFHNFTDARENLINWYPFRKNASVLEIGAGMGALTGGLCDRCMQVVAIEQSPKRAEIARLRNKDRKNLQVVCGDIYSQDFSQKFDYILLIGVLEYVGINCKVGNPYKEILDKINSLLAPNGVLLLAIENQYGLKYWCGAAEDHTGIPFDGIAGYISNGYTTRYERAGVRTFSRAALGGMLQASGFAFQRWYYPLPDYKFPMAVFSDEYLPQSSDIDAIKFTYPIESELIADEKQIYKELIANQVFPFFANSFFIEASENGLSQDFVKCALLKRDYKSEYRIATIIDSKNQVIKRHICNDAISHLKRYISNMKELEAQGIAIIDSWDEQGDVVQSWESLPRTDQIFRKYLQEGKWESAARLLDELAKNIQKSSEKYMSDTCNAAGLVKLDFNEKQEILLDGYLDMTFVNSFFDHGEIVFFDQEWKYPDVPLKFIMYRAIKYAYVQNDKISADRLYQYVGIDPDMGRQFHAAEIKLLEALMDERKCRMFDPNMYHENLTLQYKLLRDKEIREEKTRENERLLQERQNLKEIEKNLAALNSEKGKLSKENEALKVINVTELETNAQIKSELERLEEENLQLKEAERQQHSAIDGMRQDILNKEGHIQQLLEVEREYEREKHSRTYRVALIFRRISAFFLPAGSKRRFWVRLLAKGIRHPIRTLRMINLRRIKNCFTILKTEGAESASLHLRLVEEYERSGSVESTLEKLDIMQVADSPEQLRTLEDYAPLLFSVPDEPLVSIIIPAYNQFDYTYHCLESIQKYSGAIAYEILLADDCSTDLTKDIDKLVSGIFVIHNQNNLRFLRNCKHAAEQARGKYILFLNNDTQVQENWLQPLVNLMESDTSIGMTGSKLIYADGRLQEAGGILWKDASAWNYGNRQNPDDSEFNYVKDVDYISGAALMIRTSLWENVGGFDERFAPAYCEDSDLAFEVRRHGYRVVYQPLSVVVHFEGISNGTDLAAGQKKYQVENQQKFHEKWRNVLEKQHFDNGTNVFTARDRSRKKKHILVIDHYVPQYDKDAGSKTTFMYLKMLVAKGYHITFLGDNFYRHEPYTTELQQMGILVLYGPKYAEGWKEWMTENMEYFDIFYLNRPHITIKYIDFIKEHARGKIIYYGHDLHFLRNKREYELTGDPRKLAESKQWLEQEIYIMHKADMNYYPSAIECDAIRAIDSSIPVKAITAYVYEHFQDTDYQMERRKGLLFVGGFGHDPNLDAVLWFLDKVYPQVYRRTGAPFYIVGSKAPEAITSLTTEGVVVKGFVSEEELGQLYCSARIAVVPLRYGAGVKGKVVEALYYGIPLVTTSVGAEGIFNIEEAAVIKDSEQELADAICNIYADAQELTRMSRRGQALAQQNYSTDAVWNIIKEDF